MSDIGYPIILSNGNHLGGGNTEILDVSQVANSVADTSLTTLNLLRRGARGYAEEVSENFVHLLENFAGPTPPVPTGLAPLTGQLWYDTGNASLKIYNGSQYKQVGGKATGLETPVTISIRDGDNGGVNGPVLGSASFDGSTDTPISFKLAEVNSQPGDYTFATIHVDKYGRVTSAASGTIAGIGYTPANDALVVHKAGDTMSGTLTVNNADVNTTGVGKIKQNGFELLPAGAIIMWTGVVAPGGWTLCNGSNGSPDLTDRFIVSAGGSYALGQTGGTASATIATDIQGGHSHTGTGDAAGAHSHGGASGQTTLSINQIPPHTHAFQLGGGDHGNDRAADGTGNGNFLNTQSAGGGLGHDHPINSEGDHTHNISINSVAGHAHNITLDKRPPYYALAYIMKL